MIDIDALAQQRARSLSQPVEEWEFVLRIPDFEGLCQELTDGQIEKVFAISQSAKELQFLSKHLGRALAAGTADALQALLCAAEESSTPVQSLLKAWMASERLSTQPKTFEERLAQLKGLFQQNGDLETVLNLLKKPS